MPETRPEGIPGSALSGPFAVGAYADALRSRLREMARVQVFGEVVGFRVGRAKVYWELRDGRGALPCSMWRSDWEARAAGADATAGLADGTRVVCAGGPDYYPGSRTASPAFSFAATEVRLAGEGDLLAQLAALRRRLGDEGLFTPQKGLARPLLPRGIGVVCGERGKARDDVLAGLRRRGWAGRLVWAFAPVQDRHAAGAVAAALRDLASVDAVDVVIVARGGGSLADLFAFCDETLCRTVALLPVPVIASVGHHTDRTLLDDVAAVACSTPTHAAEAAVRIGVADARGALAGHAGRLARAGAAVGADHDRLRDVAGRVAGHARTVVRTRARELAGHARAPAQHLTRERARLHQRLRDVDGAARRGLQERGAAADVMAMRLATHTTDRDLRRRRGELDRLAQLLAAHDPQRTLERGYALVEDASGAPVASAAAARSLDAMSVRLHDGSLRVRPDRGAGA